jgi:phosphoenolpyruvate synthase/pyruvate phosphate dikinase
MDATGPLIVPLEGARALDNKRVGGKAAKLADLIAYGYRVPRGFCATTDAYRRFVADRALNDRIRMELGRKPLSSMRWEEIWDAEGYPPLAQAGQARRGHGRAQG